MRYLRKKCVIFVDFFKKVIIIHFCMDTKNDLKIPQCGTLADMAGKRLVVGAKQLRKALRSGIARTVFLAEDADPAITSPIEAMCQENMVSCAWIPTMRELGAACGIDVGAAAAAAID